MPVAAVYTDLRLSPCRSQTGPSPRRGCCTLPARRSACWLPQWPLCSLQFLPRELRSLAVELGFPPVVAEFVALAPAFSSGPVVLAGSLASGQLECLEPSLGQNHGR